MDYKEMYLKMMRASEKATACRMGNTHSNYIIANFVNVNIFRQLSN